jgi:hypothetical protein
MFYVVSRGGDGQCAMGWGGWLPESSIDQTITIAPNAITAGSSVTVTFTSVPAGWAVDTYLFVRDPTHIEQVKITAISGLDVTFQVFGNSYVSGSKFALEHTVFCGKCLQITHGGLLDVAFVMYVTSLPGPSSGDFLTQKYPTQQIDICTGDTYMGPLSHMLCSISFVNFDTFYLGSTLYRFFSILSNDCILIKEV